MPYVQLEVQFIHCGLVTDIDPFDGEETLVVPTTGE